MSCLDRARVITLRALHGPLPFSVLMEVPGGFLSFMFFVFWGGKPPWTQLPKKRWALGSGCLPDVGTILLGPPLVSWKPTLSGTE